MGYLTGNVTFSPLLVTPTLTTSFIMIAQDIQKVFSARVIVFTLLITNRI